MKVLVINSGSSSLKYQLIETKKATVLAKGSFERIGEPGTFYTHTAAGATASEEKLNYKTHIDAVKKMLSLVEKTTKLSELDAIGHRVVHGGEMFQQSTLATSEVLKEIDKLTPLAPLHNPANITGIRACMEVLPKVPNVMVFDTAFHATMPKSAYLYALPMENYEKHKIRRYGFHGTSHKYVAKQAAKMAGVPLKKLKIITAHVGNGASVCAIDGGKSVETSMGMTPLEGVMMGTRSGDVDPAVIEILCKAHNFTAEQCVTYLNKKCGLLGLSGLSNDMRDLRAARKTNPIAQTALDVFVHRLVKYIGAYAAVMNGVDIIVWTGGIGNNDEYTRERVMSHFAYIGADIDPVKNNLLNSSGGRNMTLEISAQNAKVRTMVINTNEELEIALDTEKVLTAKK